MVSIAIVDTLGIKTPHLVFIDQVEGRKNPYLETLNSWDSCPFKSISLFYRPIKKIVGKYKSRKKTFKALEKLVQQLKPKHLFTGNDRRVEFQYSMHIAEDLGFNPIGYYMDEGTFTYVGRKASNKFADKVLDNGIKKLAYGCWWKHPATVGASDWIQTIYVSYPDIIHPLLTTKHIKHLTLEYWQSISLINFCDLLVNTIGKPANLAKFDLLITLPHESIINANNNYKEQIKKCITLYAKEGSKIGVKYHPRDNNQDLLQLDELEAVELISRELPFEALLPMIKPGAKIIGDFSTTLISTRLLRPDLIAEAIDHGEHDKNTEFIELYKNIGITVISIV